MNNNGIGFLGLLAILFIGLKLAGIITWSWLWVLLPLWGGVAVTVGLFLIGVIIGIFWAIFASIFDR